jgi:hypothetical protein
MKVSDEMEEVRWTRTKEECEQRLLIYVTLQSLMPSHPSRNETMGKRRRHMVGIR